MNQTKDGIQDVLTDPVCGMKIDVAKATGEAEWNGKTYHFCSAHCSEKFKAHPEAFVTGGKSGGSCCGG